MHFKKRTGSYVNGRSESGKTGTIAIKTIKIFQVRGQKGQHRGIELVKRIVIKNDSQKDPQTSRKGFLFSDLIMKWHGRKEWRHAVTK
jgi:hypothetical protein